ncbi:MAG: hypothetical protein Q4C76_06080 [Bacillota bacterium]|nr:hypothetical protein [Bacillota bacterium]
MCKKLLLLPALALVLACLLGLGACGETAEVPGETAAPTAAGDANQGLYTCVSVKMNDMDIGAEGQWLQLSPRGQARIFLNQQPDPCQWSLNGTNFTLTITGEKVGTGTLKNGVLTLDLMGTQCVFLKDGAEAPKEPPAAANTAPAKDKTEEADLPPAGHAYLACSGDLYRVTYPTARFQPSSDGLTDLVGRDGTQGWLARLDTREAVDQWLAGLAAKADSPEVLSCQPLSLTVAGSPAQGAVYQDDKGWHSAVVVDFGRNRGSKTYPMFAACLSFSGDSREAVWSEDIQSIAASLELI